MLVPVLNAESGKVENETSLPMGAPNGITQVEDKGFDRQITMDKIPNLTDEMREITGEKKREWKPLVQFNEEDEGEQPQLEAPKPEPAQTIAPTEPKKDNQPSADPVWLEEMIDVGGKKMKVRDVAKSYEELQRDYGRKGQEFGSERLKYKAEIAKLDAERKFLEDMAANNFAGVPKNQKSVAPTTGVTKDKILEMIDRGETIEAIQAVVDDRTLAIRSELEQKQAALEESRRKTISDANLTIQKETIASSIESVENDPDCKSFKENRSKFALWLEDIYGNNETGMGKITELCTEAPRIKKMYQRYLRDTVDITAALQTAQAQGQAIAQVKQGLAPVADMASLVPAGGNPERKPASKERDDIDFMEGHIFKGMHRGPLAGKTGMFR